VLATARAGGPPGRGPGQTRCTGCIRVPATMLHGISSISRLLASSARLVSSRTRSEASRGAPARARAPVRPAPGIPDRRLSDTASVHDRRAIRILRRQYHVWNGGDQLGCIDRTPISNSQWTTHDGINDGHVCGEDLRPDGVPVPPLRMLCERDKKIGATAPTRPCNHAAADDRSRPLSTISSSRLDSSARWPQRSLQERVGWAPSAACPGVRPLEAAPMRRDLCTRQRIDSA
jgi:hypothetical protein